MLITNESEMQYIINSRDDLEWDGWDVVKYTKSSNAMYASDGCVRNGEWMKKKVFPITQDGWYLPNTIGRDYAQVER
jgi:hypothetical protein